MQNFLLALNVLCQRKPVCATKYLLPYESPHVEKRLKQLEEIKTTRPEQGYDVAAAMKIARENGIDWWDLKVENWPLLAQAPWWQVLSKRQQHALIFNLKLNLKKQPDNKVGFLSISSNMGRVGMLTTYEGEHLIMSAGMPGQLIYVFNEGLLPRQVLGREALALQGFPIDRLDEPTFREFIKDKEGSTEPFFGEIAGNMVSTPVTLAIVMSTLVAVSWVEPKIVAEVAEQPAPSLSQNLSRQAEDPPLQKPGGILSRVFTAPRHKMIKT